MGTILEELDIAQAKDHCSPSSTAKKILHAFIAVAITIAGVLIVTLASHPAAKDYISYWSAGKLLVDHADPYSPTPVLALERTQGYSEAKPLIMRNPPWALFLVIPLGFTGARAGLLLWTIAAVGCILAYLRLMSVTPKDHMLAFLFAPALGAIVTGQSSPFLLLGFSLFLRFHRSRPFLAGVSLLLLAIKPHLFLVFWALLLIDCTYRRNFRILAGAAAAVTVGVAFAMLLNPHIWQQYFAMLHASKLKGEFFPTTSMIFRLLIDARAYWLQLVPSVLALIWGWWYYARNRQVWDWRTHGLLLMLVTVLASPYGWFSDEIVLLHSLMFAFVFPERRKYSDGILVAINSVALVLLLAAQSTLNSGYYLWTPAAWLAWFLYARGGKPEEPDCVDAVFRCRANDHFSYSSMVTKPNGPV